MDEKEMQVNEIFFESAAESALSSFAKLGDIPVRMVALINTGRQKGEEKLYDMIPVLLGPQVDARSIEEEIEFGLTPLLDLAKKEPSSRVTMFFLATRARGEVKRPDESTQWVDVIIAAAKTDHRLGKTMSFQIVKEKEGTHYARLIPQGGDGWKMDKSLEQTDLPGAAAQYLLDRAWKMYAVGKSISLLA